MNPEPPAPPNNPPLGHEQPIIDQSGNSSPQAPKKVKRSKLKIAGIVIGSLLGAAVLINIAVFYILIGGYGHSNHAQADLRPILRQVQNLGGKAICDNGDNGYTLDNNQPWYEAYYTISSTASLTSRIESISASQGYKLKIDSTTISQLKSDGNYYGAQQKYNPASDYLVGQKGGAYLNIIINRDTSVALNCSSGTYGRLQNTNGNAIIDFSMSLPSTN
jgi:hypothetical protein